MKSLRNSTPFCCLLIAMSIWATAASAALQKPVGLTNQGNTCFMNAILQALLVTPYFQVLTRFTTSCPKFTEASRQVNNSSLALINDLIKFNNGYYTLASKNTGGAYNTQNLYNALFQYQVPLNIVQGQQGDADEMLTAISTQLQTVIDKLNTNDQKKCKADPFHYSYTDRTLCTTCGRIRTHNESDTFLLAVANAEGTVDIAKTILDFGEPEALPDRICDTCKAKGADDGKNRVVRVNRWITELPQSLAFRINITTIKAILTGAYTEIIRKQVFDSAGTPILDEDGTILTQEVTRERPQWLAQQVRIVSKSIIPEIIDASPLLEQAPFGQTPSSPSSFSSTLSDATYRLAAMVLHGGGSTSGHYTAYVKYGGKWFYCSDETILPATQDIHTWTENTQPRLLFYIKEQPEDSLEDLSAQLNLLVASTR